MKVVVCGGGVVGCSIAYFLAKRGVACSVVERCGIACAASGKAGGFLARDWCDGSEVGPLARLSFDLHEQLGREFGDTDYRKLDTLSITAKEGKRRELKDAPDWLDGDVLDFQSIGTTSTTAQVHPYKLTHAYFTHAQKLVGTKLHKGIVEGVELSDDGTKVTGVKVSGTVLEADVVVIAMGPWSGQAAQWLRVPPIAGRRAHSIVLQPAQPVSAHALFTDVTSRDGGRSRDPEVYPRPDGEVYVCGMSDGEPLPVDPAEVKVNEESCRVIQRDSAIVSSRLGSSASLKTTQACYLPTPRDGLPVIGKVPGVQGAFIATGHTCWGILNSPGTGAAMAELILDGVASVVDLTPFDPARFF